MKSPLAPAQNPDMRNTLLLLLALAGSQAALAQSTCPAGWPPCGADRVLNEAEIRAHLFKPGEVTRIQMTGGTSGRKFQLGLRPDAKLDLSREGGPNFGRDWKLEGDRLCLRAYQNVWGGQFNCGAVELKDGKVLWVETMGDGSRNPLDAVEFVKP
jgi:hypothetical protein